MADERNKPDPKLSALEGAVDPEALEALKQKYEGAVDPELLKDLQEKTQGDLEEYKRQEDEANRRINDSAETTRKFYSMDAEEEKEED